MLIDFDQASARRDYDYCVIGTGPAGLTFAMEMAAKGKSILLLEGGDLDYTEESQDMYRGTVTGDPYMDPIIAGSRLRRFGGTSGHWGGWCRPLDPIDFEPKKGFPTAQWPIRRPVLDPYIAKASEILEVGEFPTDVDLGHGIKQFKFLYSGPVRFAEKYYGPVEASPQIDLSLNTNVTAIETDGRKVTGAVIRAYDGRTARVEARTFVLATGGIENSRLLLWSNRLAKGRLIKDDRTLGRYWMEHPHFTLGVLFFDGSMRGWTFYNLTPERQRELGVLNCGLRLINARPTQVEPALAELAAQAPETAARMRAGLADGTIFAGQLRAAWEMEPHADNRVTLSETETDRFGNPSPVLHWHKSERDRNTMRQTALEFGKRLVRENHGRLKLNAFVWGDEDFPDNDEIGGNHHMGGTRMADHSSRGIVDTDLKVFGQENLYILGSSVFPASGHANPTFTIVQLALRLAEHLG